MIMSTTSSPISKDSLVAALKTHFGFENFKGNQEAIIRSLIDGNDTFVLMPTGGGKSLCYQLPSLLLEGTAIVISPLIALMKNQVDAMRQFSDVDDLAHFLNSSLSKQAVEKVKTDITDGRTRLLYVAPESLTKEENIEFLKSVKISFYAVDEAHCISEWGHDFRPEYRRIRPIINEICRRPIIALTATATPKVQHDIQKNLGIPDAKVFKSSFNRENLYYEIRPKTADTDKDIIRLIKNNAGKSGIIYCLSRKKVEELAEILRLNDIKALAYHAGMDSATRSFNQDAFIHEKVDVIVATIAFGMGIDKPDVRFVIHYDMPKSLEGYYQETGRAGRDGGEGRCVTYYSRKDLQRIEKFLQGKTIPEQEIGRQLLAETAVYAESSICRRTLLLSYFGERYDVDSCDNCDNCVHPNKKIEATQFAIVALETLASLNEYVRLEHLADILIGRESQSVKSYGHEKNEYFGYFKGSEIKMLNSVIRQAILSGLIEKDVENIGFITISQEGRNYLRKPSKFYITEDKDFSEFDSDIPGNTSGAADNELFAILKNLRKSVARRHNLPPYVIFQDPSLEAMATTYPVTMEELHNVPGVGEGKARRYGQEFIDVIRRYVEENEIERPEDLRVRTHPNKSKDKLAIITAIDRMIPLDEFAASKGWEFAELLEQIESIVYSGCRINIKYFIDDIIDEDSQQEIFDYFRSSESDNIDSAMKEFDNDFNEDELRMMRIRFVSEMGN